MQNLGANPRCVYIPASLISGGEELSEYGIEPVDDGYMRSQSLINGTRGYAWLFMLLNRSGISLPTDLF